MKQFIRLFMLLLTLPCVLLLTGCSTSGSSTSVSYGVGVYGGYGYPYYGYGYGGCCYGTDRPNRPDRPDRPDRPNRPDRPDRPSTMPVTRPSGSMGRPSSPQMSRPARMPSGGGGRRR